MAAAAAAAAVPYCWLHMYYEQLHPTAAAATVAPLSFICCWTVTSDWGLPYRQGTPIVLP
jgi:hypothetical protein